ncbi:MAG: alpha/beta hydrolase fold domain-containing protein [Phycisphaerae bacterium]|nr:alpha/beta hydrolase fold domain-containing protein [Phycisphaerae bacterium]
MASNRYGIIVLPAALLSALPACQSALPPGQPEAGPGGADYVHLSMKESRFGREGLEYWLFEPAEPTPNSAPLVVFNHGWSAMEPKGYVAWIEHIVRRGNIVVYPRYQASLKAPFSEFMPNTLAAVKDGIARLQSGGHVRPELDHVATVGHSIGGQISANLAAVAADEALPVFKAVMCVEPWGPGHDIPWHVPFEDLSRIPAGTLLLTIVGDADAFAGDIGARIIFDGAAQVSPEDKDFVVLNSDDHGRPRLVATHFAPAASGKAAGGSLLSPDALDYYGTWKLFDALADAAFHGTHREYALGDTPEQRFMGLWSDGTPVNELVVTDAP